MTILAALQTLRKFPSLTQALQRAEADIVADRAKRQAEKDAWESTAVQEQAKLQAEKDAWESTAKHQQAQLQAENLKDAWESTAKNEHAQLQAEKDAWESAANKLVRSTSPAPIKLNIGGKRFETSATTLRSTEGSFFSAMLSGRWELQACEDGSYFIDRDPSTFPHILNYLRGIELDIELFAKAELAALRHEADFYGLTDLADALAPHAVLSPGPLSPGPNYTLSADQCKATKSNLNGWGSYETAIVLGPKLVADVALPVCTSGKHIMIGAASLDISQTQADAFKHHGFYCSARSGMLYAQGGISDKAYGADIGPGSTVGVLMDAAGNLSFIVNGVNEGVAYAAAAIGHAPLRLVVVIYSAAGTVELLSP
ncbi:hypothetical protein JKP88DRAFT_328961 [Tribonema minus]|uniref:BTB domain-containing protein n=1 Tax=Tribonema minus TaxID=303371 RepID=A0A835YP87_9STRA|nr:hypothetical protein JKP88DRAFT_328961 [Tribonema minus]